MVARMYSDIKSWTLSHFGWGSRTEELRHAVDHHWRMGSSDLKQRAAKKRGDASTFYYMDDEGLEKIFAFFLKTREHQEWLLRWINTQSDITDMVFIHNFDKRIGVVYRYDEGKLEVCQRAVFIVRKTSMNAYPKVISSFPVPKDYRVKPGELASRYKKK